MAFESHVISPSKSHLATGTLACALLCLLQTACTSTTPTIAHTHVGHAITGAHDTPQKDGYFVVAEQRAAEALKLAEAATAPNQSSAQIAEQLSLVNKEVNLRSDFPLASALKEAASHIAFAADSEDSSDNVKRSSRAFSEAIEGVVARANLINLYSQDARISTSEEETKQLASEIYKLSQANITGQDIDGDGVIGNQVSEYGMRQLRRDLDALVNREDPAYTTVDRWYLFNLVRLPSGDWLFRKRDSSKASSY